MGTKSGSSFEDALGVPARGKDEPEGLNQPKPQVGVVFVDEHGVPHAMQYSHLYRCYVEGRELVAEFTGHRVVMAGERLWAPLHGSLLMLLTLHKRDLVAVPALGDRHAGFETGKEPWVVRSIRVEAKE